jgi:hypothetical protein
MAERPPPPEELAESQARSFPASWWVADAYRIERGFVIPLVGGAPIRVMDFYEGRAAMREYMPIAHPELPAEFAKLDGGGPDAVLAFVQRYGTPGFGRFRLDDVWGDPIAWILGHARAVRLVGDLASALDDEELLTQRLEELKATTGGSEWIAFPLMERDSRYPGVLNVSALSPVATGRETALSAISWQLNAVLPGVSRAVAIRADAVPPRLESFFNPEDLIACIYWLLADAVVGRTIRRCSACGRFFVATHDRMKYCPPPMGHEGASRCMNRAKQRRLRAGQRAQRAPRRARRGGTP